MPFILFKEITDNTEGKDLHTCLILHNVLHGALMAVLFTHVTASLGNMPETLTKGEHTYWKGCFQNAAHSQWKTNCSTRETLQTEAKHFDL